MIPINLQILGVKTVQSRIARSRLNLQRKKAAFHKAIIFIDAWIQKNFQSEGGELDEKWQSLAESTINRRRKGKSKSRNARILQDTGGLKSRWRHFYNDKSASIVGLPYGVYHDSPEPRRHLPRRQILPDDKHIRGGINKIFNDFIRVSLK